MKVANKSFQDVEKFKYLRSTITDQNSIVEEISRRLNSGNDCYYAVKSPCPSPKRHSYRLQFTCSGRFCMSVKFDLSH
jgi:UDP-galactopyranose mutase